MPNEQRREFLMRMARWGVGTAAAPAALAAFAEELLAAPGAPYVEADYYERLPNKQIECTLCPLKCVLDDGLTCHCNTRTNHGGVLYSHAFGNPCILRTDPIEKLPFHHFLPGTQSLSIAVGGCNLRCLYCQNWQQSMVRPESLRTFDLPPRRAATGAQEGKLPTIALTYTEPVTWIEYAERIAHHAHRHEVKVAVATGTYISKEPMRRFAKAVDGMCLALKGFSEKFYEDVIGGKFAPVLDAIIVAKEAGTWVEIANLIVPTLNDDMKQIREMAKWIKRYVGKETPLHFARFVPEYKLKNLPQTPVPTLAQAREVALEVGLKHVYTTNVAPHEGSGTYCSGCKRPLIRRVGFRILENRVKNGRCPHCKRSVPGVWE